MQTFPGQFFINKRTFALENQILFLDMRLKVLHVERFFQFKSNLNVLKGVVIFYQEIVVAFIYLLINDHYTFKNVQITFKLKNCFTCNSVNVIYVVICDTCKEEYIGETGDRKKREAESECINNTFGKHNTIN